MVTVRTFLGALIGPGARVDRVDVSSRGDIRCFLFKSSVTPRGDSKLFAKRVVPGSAGCAVLESLVSGAMLGRDKAATREVIFLFFLLTYRASLSDEDSSSESLTLCAGGGSVTALFRVAFVDLFLNIIAGLTSDSDVTSAFSLSAIFVDKTPSFS